VPISLYLKLEGSLQAQFIPCFSTSGSAGTLVEIGSRDFFKTQFY
jgi:hypothetical protein